MLVLIGSSVGESTLTSGTYTLPAKQQPSVDRDTLSPCKFEQTIIYTPNSHYWKHNSSEQYRPVSAPKIYTEDKLEMMNVDPVVKYRDLEHSQARNTLQRYHHLQTNGPSNGNYSVRSSYEIELNNFRSPNHSNKSLNNNNNNNSKNRSHSRFNTISSSFNRNPGSDDLKFYSSVRSHSNPFKANYDHQNTLSNNDAHEFIGAVASPRRSLLHNLQNQSKFSHLEGISTSKSIGNHEKHSSSTRSLCTGLPSNKYVEQTAEIGLYKTAMFVIPSPNSNSLTNMHNIMDRYGQSSHRHHPHQQQQQHRQNHHRHHSHHRYNHKDCGDNSLNTKSFDDKVRTYVCSGCGRTTSKRKKSKHLTPAPAYSCVSLDKCSTPHFVSSEFKNHSHFDVTDEYDRSIFKSPGRYQEDQLYRASPVRKSLDYNEQKRIQHNINCKTNYSDSSNSLDKIKSYNHLPKSLQPSNTTPRSDCNKIVVDIKPRQMNEADKQQHITQWIQIGTLGDTANSATASPLPPDEYQDRDLLMLNLSKYSDEADVAVTVSDYAEADIGWTRSRMTFSRQDNQQVKLKSTNQPTTSPSLSPREQHQREQYKQRHEYKAKNQPKIEIIKQMTNSQQNGEQNQKINKDSSPRNVPEFDYANTSKNEIKLEFVNNVNHYSNSNDNDGNNSVISEKGDMKNPPLTELMNKETEFVKAESYHKNGTEKNTSSETLDSSASRSTPIGYRKTDTERVITIKGSKVLNNNGKNSTQFKLSQEKVSPTLSLNIDSDSQSVSLTSLRAPPRVPPKPKTCETEGILSNGRKKRASTLTAAEIRYMNSKISSNLSNFRDINSLFSTTQLNKTDTLNTSTVAATELFPNLVQNRDTPIPNVKNLVSYFSELIRLHTDVQDSHHISLASDINNLNREKGFDFGSPVSHHEEANGGDGVDDEIHTPASISPFLLHHETPTARERRLQAVEMLRRRSLAHMKYDPYRVFPPGYSASSSSFLDRLSQRMTDGNREDYATDDNICSGENNYDTDPIQRPLSAPRFQVRMQANLQKDSTAIATQ
ncbi:unnamed protein product [Heterobilharzia americana]|nr:unnamed protein product [Heterobilharzia americana]